MQLDNPSTRVEPISLQAHDSLMESIYLHLLEEMYDTAENHVCCRSEECRCNHGEYGRDDKGPERLGVEMGDEGVDVGYEFDYRVWVSWRQVETDRQMPPTRAGIINQARKRID